MAATNSIRKTRATLITNEKALLHDVVAGANSARQVAQRLMATMQVSSPARAYTLTLTADEFFALQDLPGCERGEAFERMADAVKAGDVELVREILGFIDTCAALAKKVGVRVGELPA
jgi:hypothetical protein